MGRTAYSAARVTDVCVDFIRNWGLPASKEPEELFHRKANHRTQTVRVAVQQNSSRELWGKGAFGGLPAALAYLGEMPDNEEGTEFTTPVPYARNGDPAWAYWYRPEDGGDRRVRHEVKGGRSFACVEIQPIRNRYRCR